MILAKIQEGVNKMKVDDLIKELRSIKKRRGGDLDVYIAIREGSSYSTANDIKADVFKTERSHEYNENTYYDAVWIFDRCIDGHFDVGAVK